ncbi:TPA: hypothetical protein N6208_005383, partial [Escherichia coli]|nr:hypothetical protein [Escherichia coli]
MKNMAIKNIDYYNDIRSCKRVIIQAFDSTNISGQDKDNLCKEIETAIEKEILPLDEFDWVKNDERAAFWICAYLLHTPIISNQMITGSDNIYCPSMSSGNLQQYHNEYIYLGFHDIPDTHNKRFERIIRFFDHLSD